MMRVRDESKRGTLVGAGAIFFLPRSDDIVYYGRIGDRGGLRMLTDEAQREGDRFPEGRRE